MKAFQRANINAFLSALIWGVVAGFVIEFSISSIANQRLLAALQYGGVFLYPALVFIILRRKIGLWLNPSYFSIMGAVTSSLSRDLFSAFQNQVWMNFLFLAVFLGMVLFMTPRVEPALRHEWDSPFWEKFNQSSFVEFLFLQFHSIDDDAG